MTKRLLAVAIAAPLLGTAGLSAQTATSYVDRFDPAGIGANSFAAGQITNVWKNWFGNAFRSLQWDATSDADGNPSSGPMEITADFDGTGSVPNQFAVYDFIGLLPPVNGMQYTNFECDVRFAAGSATQTNNGVPLFGHLIFGVSQGWGQDYFGGQDIPANNTNWIHISLPIDPGLDLNLADIYNVIIHLYGPYYSPGLNGPSTLWVDNIKFTGAAPQTATCSVDWNDVHQRIDGFGASSGFRQSITTNQADLFFSTNSGIGLSLLKSVIVAGTTVETNIMQMAQARGARVWATPYTPPANFKDNNSLNSGDFLSASNQAYASLLAGFTASLQQNYGVNLYAISIQNEPNVAASYPSCLWTPQQIHDFAPLLAMALVASNVPATKLMLAEDGDWETNYYETAMSDPAVATNVAIVACHNYDGGPPSGIPGPLPKFANTNAALWESETSSYEPFDGSMANALYWANRIHLFMTGANVNAWNYWWLIVDNNNNDNEGLTDLSGNPAKRLYVLGNYSRFVRPGYYRIGVTNDIFTSVSAYKDPVSGSFAIVAINPAPTNELQIFNLKNFTATAVTPWITSSNFSLVSQPAVNVTNASFAYTLPAMSVVTFVGAPPAAIPALKVSATNSAALINLSWPVSSQFVLQQTPNLADPNWTNSGYATANDGTNESISLSPQSASLYFRLKQSGF